MDPIQPSSVLKRQIFNLYNRDPRGWRIFVSRDSKGFSDVAVTHPPNTWFFKEQMINPFKVVGYGVKVKMENREALKDGLPYNFGLRPLSKQRIAEIAELMEREESVDAAMERIMKIPPITYSAAASHGSLFAQGPIVVRQDAIQGLSTNQKKLDERLKAELEKLLLKKHPQTILPYM